MYFFEDLHLDFCHTLQASLHLQNMSRKYACPCRNNNQSFQTRRINCRLIKSKNLCCLDNKKSITTSTSGADAGTFVFKFNFFIVLQNFVKKQKFIFVLKKCTHTYVYIHHYPSYFEHTHSLSLFHTHTHTLPYSMLMYYSFLLPHNSANPSFLCFSLSFSLSFSLIKQQQK